MATTAHRGRDALMKVSTDGGSVFATVGGIRTNNFTINNEPVDITNADSAGFRELLADGGVQSIDMSGDGVVVDAVAFQTMLTQTKDRTKLTYQINFGNGGKITSKFVIGSMQITGAHNDAQTFSVSMQSDGQATITLPT